MKKLLDVIVGSRAHGLETPESDYDKRGVFLYTTNTILGIGPNTENQQLTLAGPDGGDDALWELKHFMSYCCKANPTMLEVLKGPVSESTPEGDELRSLFKDFLSGPAVHAACMRYATHQHKDVLRHGLGDKRSNKAMCAMLRVGLMGWELLAHGDFNIRAGDDPMWGKVLKEAKLGKLKHADAIDSLNLLKERMDESLKYTHLPEKPNYEKLNEFLLRVRKNHWV